MVRAMSRISWSLICLAVGVVAYSTNLLLDEIWNRASSVFGSHGFELPFLALQMLGIPTIIVGILLFVWGIYDWVQKATKKPGSPTQPAQVNAGKT